MFSAGPLFLISASLFVVWSFVTRQEQVRGSRLFLSGLRARCDSVFEAVYLYLRERVRRIVRHTIKLSWYYSLHSALRAILTILVKLYDSLELVFINNRENARKLRAEKRGVTGVKSHLTMISEHKAESALTPSQKKKLKAKRLAGE